MFAIEYKNGTRTYYGPFPDIDSCLARFSSLIEEKKEEFMEEDAEFMEEHKDDFPYCLGCMKYGSRAVSEDGLIPKNLVLEIFRREKYYNPESYRVFTMITFIE